MGITCESLEEVDEEIEEGCCESSEGGVMGK